jgi:putative transcriptional regulator
MQLQAGSLLQSSNTLKGTFFENSTILLTEYNAAGAVGFVINKLFHRQLNELEEFKQSPSFPLYEGGPVDTTHLYFIHQRPDIIDKGNSIGNGIYYSGNFKQAITAISNKSIGTTDIKIFIGYCGWNAGELEAEIEEGSWSMLNELNIFNM